MDPVEDPRPRVLVVDDDPGMVDLLCRALGSAGFLVRPATDGDDALRAVERWMPDAVVLDVLMPGIDGFTVCRRARAADPGLGILMLTGKDGATDEIVGLESGADDYLTKPFSVRVLVAHLRALLRRREPSAGGVLEYDDLRLDTSAHVARRGASEIHLTTTEYRLLHEFMRAPEQVLSKEFLTDRVWGYAFGGSQNVLEVYVRYLRTKLEPDGAARLIQTLRGSGYMLRRSVP